MTAYEAGFSAGERQAFIDRRERKTRDFRSVVQSEYQRGYRDGYTPRSITWLLVKDPRPYWADRESEIA